MTAIAWDGRYLVCDRGVSFDDSLELVDKMTLAYGLEGEGITAAFAYTGLLAFMRPLSNFVLGNSADLNCRDYNSDPCRIAGILVDYDNNGQAIAKYVFNNGETVHMLNTIMTAGSVSEYLCGYMFALRDVEGSETAIRAIKAARANNNNISGTDVPIDIYDSLKRERWAEL